MSVTLSHRSRLITKVTTNTVDVDVDVVLVVMSHPLHVLSHPTGATRVSHKPLAKIAWQVDSSSVFVLLLQRSVVEVVVVVLVVEVVTVVEVLVLVLVEVVYVVVLVLELVDVDVVVVVVSQPLHVLSHSPGTLAHNP